MQIDIKKKKINKTLIMLTIGSLLLAGCGKKESKEEGVIFNNDFEATLGWIENVNGVVRGEAHSGNFLCKTDTLGPYGNTFTLELNKISDKPLKKVSASVWMLKSTDAAEGVLVIEISNKDKKSLAYISSLTKGVANSTHEWTNIEAFSDLTKKDLNNPSNKITVVFINTSKDRIDIDDVKIKFE